jgi:hypothetical protein
MCDDVSDAEVGDVERLWICLAVRNQRVDIARRQRNVRDQHLRPARPERDRREVAERIVRHVGERMRVLRERAV